MAKNVEIKARAHDFSNQLQTAQQLAQSEPQILIQQDTFFVVPDGRLKLRQFPDAPAELIFYQRDDALGPKLSDYHISRSSDGDGLKNVLEKAYGIRQIVRKRRYLFLLGRTRVHFDQVQGLGEFIELEVVLKSDDQIESGQTEAKQLMHQLGVAETDLIDVAYVDLLGAIDASD